MQYMFGCSVMRLVAPTRQGQGGQSGQGSVSQALMLGLGLRLNEKERAVGSKV